MYLTQIAKRQWEEQRNGVIDRSPMSRLRDQDGGDGTITKLREVPQFKVDNFVLTVEWDDGGEFYKKKAETELRETPELVEQSLKDIRVLLQGETDLVLPDDDEFYQKFLRPCKWYPKSSCELIKRFYKFRINNPKYSEKLSPLSDKKALSSEILVPLPERTPDGCRVLYLNIGRKWVPKVVSTDELFRAVMLSLDAAVAEPKTQVSGVHVILDMDGLSLNQVTYITPSFAASMAEWVQRCLPCRLKGIHVVNQPFIFNMVYAIFKPFLLEKTRKRLFFHGTERKQLIQFISTKALPVELGGEVVIPKVPFGEGIADYFCYFQQDFEEANKYGYRKAAKR